MRDVAIVSFARTPCGRAVKGSLRDTRPDTLAALAVKEAVARAGEALDPKLLGDVVLGCAMPEGEQGMNVARVAVHLAGLPDEIPAMTINRFCSSGLQAIAIAAGQIAIGAMDAVVAGGVESMSMVPMGGNKPSAHPGLFAERPESYTGMGITAENVARTFEISRERQDEFAYTSHMRAAAAREAGKFADEIVAVETSVFEETGERKLKLEHDELIRPQTTQEGLAKLRPVFHAKGSVTPGNSSPLTDGAAAVVLMAADRAQELGLTVHGYFRNFSVVGTDPAIMGIGPVPAIRKLMELSGKKTDEIQTYEINEAFAAQASYCVQELGLDPARVNPNGGAIALGHPLGATGAILTCKLLSEMKREDQKLGVVSMCIGGGMGAAGLFERA
ncbi:MAG: acetyl-CoA C-acyltransferase [Deltaproteobacteria bacterium]|nr:MAG: acetyl-CoA C-acyltransferase [Deltaproteobacteria bacterium]